MASTAKINIRVSKAFKSSVENQAKQQGKTISDYVKKVLLTNLKD